VAIKRIWDKLPRPLEHIDRIAKDKDGPSTRATTTDHPADFACDYERSLQSLRPNTIGEFEQVRDDQACHTRVYIGQHDQVPFLWVDVAANSTNDQIANRSPACLKGHREGVAHLAVLVGCA